MIGGRTIQPTLNNNGLESHRPHKVPLLMTGHIKASLIYANTFIDKESTFWYRILCSDDTKIELLGYNDVKMIW